MSSNVSLCSHPSPSVASRLNGHHPPSVAITLLMSLSTPLIRFRSKPPLPPYVAAFPPLCRHHLMSPAPLFCCYFSFMESSLLISRRHTPVHPHTSSVTKSLNRSLSSLTSFSPFMSPFSRITFAPSSHCPCLTLVFPIRSYSALQLFFSPPCLVIFPCHLSDPHHHMGY